MEKGQVWILILLSHLWAASSREVKVFSSIITIFFTLLYLRVGLKTGKKVLSCSARPFIFKIFSLKGNKIQGLVCTFVPLELGSLIFKGEKWPKLPKVPANPILLKVTIWAILAQFKKMEGCNKQEYICLIPNSFEHCLYVFYSYELEQAVCTSKG